MDHYRTLFLCVPSSYKASVSSQSSAKLPASSISFCLLDLTGAVFAFSLVHTKDFHSRTIDDIAHFFQLFLCCAHLLLQDFDQIIVNCLPFFPLNSFRPLHIRSVPHNLFLYGGLYDWVGRASGTSVLVFSASTARVLMLSEFCLSPFAVLHLTELTFPS